MISNSVIKAPLNLKAQQGDTFSRQFSFLNEEDVAIDLSSSTFKLTIKDNSGTTILEWLNSDFSLISTGVYSIGKTATQMQSVNPGVYSYDLQVTNSSSETRTWIFGQFIIEQQSTV